MISFADDNTISAAENTMAKLISTLEQDSQDAIDWFKLNDMIVNPDKFQEKEKQVFLNSFVLSNFNYCPLVWHFRSSKSF